MKRLATRLSTAILLSLPLFLLGCGGPNLFERLESPWYYGICSTIIVILDIIALIEIAGSDREFGNKALWALLIIFLPVLGLILYWVFER